MVGEARQRGGGRLASGGAEDFVLALGDGAAFFVHPGEGVVAIGGAGINHDAGFQGGRLKEEGGSGFPTTQIEVADTEVGAAGDGERLPEGGQKLLRNVVEDARHGRIYTGGGSSGRAPNWKARRTGGESKAGHPSDNKTVTAHQFVPSFAASEPW
jgi:hypothetical protein